jgi:hypothetical protein
MKKEFYRTFFKLSGDWNCITLKKKFGKFWSCIEYAIFENVQFSSSSCSPFERMKEKHNQNWLSCENSTQLGSKP